MADQNSAIWAAMTSGWPSAQRVVANLGNGTVEYVGVQAEEPPELNMWTVRTYGRPVLSDRSARTQRRDAIVQHVVAFLPVSPSHRQ